MRFSIRLSASVLCLATVVAACGSSGGSTASGNAGASTSTAATTVAETTAAETSAATTAAPSTSMAMSMKTTYPVTIENCGRKLTFAKAPERTLILNGTSVGEVESFIVLGLQSRIVANSQFYGVSDDPTMVAEIGKIPTGGLKLDSSTFEVPREQILGQNPDLVVSTWAGGLTPEMGTLSRDDLDKLGIASYITPSNCAYGDPAASAADQAALKAQSWKSSYELIRDLGVIFDVQEKAEAYIAESQARIEKVVKPATGKTVHVLIAFPGMSMMNKNGLPAIFGGPLYDSIIGAAGGVNSFAGMQFTDMSSINAEQLAAAQVDVVAIGLFQPTENAELFANDLFAQYPQWNASKSKNFVTVSDSIYLGPLNAIAVENLAKAIAKA